MVRRFSLLMASVLAGCLPALAQTCPIKITTVTQQVLAEGSGAKAVLLVRYRNQTPFVVRGIQFGIQTFDEKQMRRGRSQKLLALHVLKPGVESILAWNATRFDKKHMQWQFVVWPAIVVLDDGSEWLGSAREWGVFGDH
jgi:hypothetical protein